MSTHNDTQKNTGMPSGGMAPGNAMRPGGMRPGAAFGRGGPQAMMKGEKARNFKGTMKKLIAYLLKYILNIIISYISIISIRIIYIN